eukprot:IDg6853t1
MENHIKNRFLEHGNDDRSVVFGLDDEFQPSLKPLLSPPIPLFSCMCSTFERTICFYLISGAPPYGGFALHSVLGKTLKNARKDSQRAQQITDLDSIKIVLFQENTSAACQQLYLLRISI